MFSLTTECWLDAEAANSPAFSLTTDIPEQPDHINDDNHSGAPKVEVRGTVFLPADCFLDEVEDDPTGPNSLLFDH
jgi:hypothetical protein